MCEEVIKFIEQIETQENFTYTTEELEEMKEWDVTLMDGLENEPTVTMSKLDMNLFAFVVWLVRNQHSHSISGLTIDDGYEWYNHMWNQWLRNSDIGKKISNGEITTVNNNPDTNTSTTGNISNTWEENTWTSTETDSRAMSEKQIWDKTVNWDIINKHTRVNDEEQAPYNVKTKVNTVSKPDETSDGTIAVIEITIDIRSN
jgi:ferritin